MQLEIQHVIAKAKRESDVECVHNGAVLYQYTCNVQNQVLNNSDMMLNAQFDSGPVYHNLTNVPHN